MNEPASSTQLSLLSRAARRDSAAWRQVVDLYGPLILHWCRKSGLRPDISADCMQEVFAAVLKALPRFQPTREHGSFRAWLWTITKRKIIDTVSAEHKQATSRGGSTAMSLLNKVSDHEQTSAVHIFDEEPTGEQQLKSITARAMRQIEPDFSKRSWSIFNRCVIDQIDTAEVAKEFGITAAAVRQTRSRILRRLRSQLGDIDS